MSVAKRNRAHSSKEWDALHATIVEQRREIDKLRRENVMLCNTTTPSPLVELEQSLIAACTRFVDLQVCDGMPEGVYASARLALVKAHNEYIEHLPGVQRTDAQLERVRRFYAKELERIERMEARNGRIQVHSEDVPQLQAD